MPGTRKLGRTSDHRKAMLRGLVTYLLENGRIETTVTRAQEVRAMAEKMITIAKDDSLHSKRKVRLSTGGMILPKHVTKLTYRIRPHFPKMAIPPTILELLA